MSINQMSKIQLWHSHNARSLRTLWALEEMELPYELNILNFPPRYYDRDFLEINPLGTVPYLIDGDSRMTESSAMCLYLAEKYQKKDFFISVEEPGYGEFLNWLHHADATLTFPLTLVMRYQFFEDDERKNPQIVEDYRRWFLARLRLLDSALESKQWLCNERFTIADIVVGYALYLGELIGLEQQYSPTCTKYLQKLKTRIAFQKAFDLARDRDDLSEFLNLDERI